MRGNRKESLPIQLGGGVARKPSKGLKTERGQVFWYAGEED